MTGRLPGLWSVPIWAGWLLIAIWALFTLPQVPFHPDEATHIFISQDFDRLFSQGDLAGVTWQASDASSAVLRYRLLEAPLSRYLIGGGRALGGHGSVQLPADWDWSGTWADNGRLGALPHPDLLLASRLPAAVLTILSLLPLFAIGQHLGGRLAAFGAVCLYCLSGVVWLHGRRAMSEGPLLFFSLLAFWIALRWPRWPLVVAAGAALAGLAKLTGLSLLPPTALAVLTAPPLGPGRAAPGRSRIGALAAFAVAFALLTWALNPSLWSSPLSGLRAMAAARQTLQASQTAEIQAAGASLALATPPRRALAMLYHSYWAPLAYWDIPNYAADTAAAEALYQQSWLNRGWRAPTAAGALPAGNLVLAISLLGLAAGLYRLLRPSTQTGHPERLALALLAVWTLATIAGLFAVTIAWQRYYLPLIPLLCLWAGYGLRALVQAWRRLRDPAARPRPRSAPTA
ncbi:MAG: hypothetical protein IT318_10020 [Anaerolineales bacterium]|nr:hypothetical protein [Anaerolineales bacterium]